MASSLAAPRYLDYGAVSSIAGSGTRFAIATASGRVLHYDAATSTLEAASADFSDHVRLSSDGSVLAAAGGFLTFAAGGGLTDAQKTRVYNLPGEGLVSTWPSNNVDLPPVDISLSGSGMFLGQVFAAGTATVNPVSGGAFTWTNTTDCRSGLLLSPDGSHIACPYALAAPQSPDTNSTLLFNNNSTAAGMALQGLAYAWLDNGHLLVSNYKGTGVLASNWGYDTAIVYSPAGTVLSKPPLPELLAAQVLSPDSIYSAKLNAIFTVSSGTGTWISTTASDGVGAVAGSNVLFASGRFVLSLPQ